MAIHVEIFLGNYGAEDSRTKEKCLCFEACALCLSSTMESSRLHMWQNLVECRRYPTASSARMKAPHLPFSCKFNDNKTLASYANVIYYYYDVERIEEFVAFKGAYEIESLFEKCENYDDYVYIPKNYA